MRIWVLVLLLANLLFFSWSRWFSGAQAPATAAPVVPSLQLAARGAAGGAGEALVCHRLGPIVGETAATAAQSALAAMQFEVRSESSERQVPQQYLVYVSVPANRVEQRRLLTQLVRAGIDDAAAITMETGEQRISVGVFSDAAGATARASAVRAAGLSPETELRNRLVQEYWLTLRIPADASLPPPEQLGADLGRAAWSDCPPESAGS